MAHGEVQEREDLSEDTFLKNLYLYMKNRDTPIERIPHLGFKQIDLYVMYKTVKDLGGYHQVTAQQMWKQVYNTLGGNPRSTSAATCTRRHYEKLLLPYECHVKGGELMNALPQHHLHHHPHHPHHHPHHPHPHQNKAFLQYGGGCHEDDIQRAAKRRSFVLHRNPRFPSDSHLRVVPLPGHHYPHYFHPGQPVLPPYVPLSPASALQVSHGSPVPRPGTEQLPYDPSPPPVPQERAKHPLEQLRYLAEQYKSSSGLAEPLNLSVKGSNPDANLNPASSFMSPPSSKTPKFLNKPSPLYPPKGVTKCETQDKEDDLGKCSSSSFAAHPPFSPNGDTGDVINLTSLSSAPSACPSAPSAPTPPMSCKGQDAAMAHAPCSSPKTQFKVWPGKETEQSPKASSRTHASSDSRVLTSPPRDNDNGKMEIQIPLSLLQDFFRHCRPSATNMHGAPQLPTSTPTQEADSRGRTWYSSDPSPANMNVHTHPSDKDSCSSAIEDLSRKQRSVPNAAPASHPYARVPNHFPSYRQSPLGALFPKDAPSHGVYPWDRQDVSSKPYNFKAANGWHPHDRERQQAHPVQMKVHSSPLIAEHDFGVARSPPAYNESTQQERPENGPASAVLHLTNEELMKLKRIISTSP